MRVPQEWDDLYESSISIGNPDLRRANQHLTTDQALGAIRGAEMVAKRRDALDRLNSAAAELRKAHPNLTEPRLLQKCTGFTPSWPVRKDRLRAAPFLRSGTTRSPLHPVARARRTLASARPDREHPLPSIGAPCLLHFSNS
jgi:hypothetical protein